MNITGKKTVLLMLLLAGLTAGFSAALNSLDQEILRTYIEKGAPSDFILIDVRKAEEIIAAIGNADCRPYNLEWPTQFVRECEKIPKDKMVIVYCQSGARAMKAAAHLNYLGYNNVFNAGGILTWKGPTVRASDLKAASLLPEPSMQAKIRN
jgi:rhodanese-related sulfurtransferase